MKWNKTIVLTALLSGGLITVAPHTFAAASSDSKPAQREGKRGGADRLEKMAKDLNLTDDQKEKVKEVFKDQAGKMKALRDDQSLSKEDRRAKLKEIREDMDGKIKAILTPDQQQKWADLRANGKKQKKEKS